MGPAQMGRSGADLDKLRGYLEDYLRQKGINTRKLFRCLSPEHEDKNPSMSYNAKARNVHCFACGVTYDLFDLIGMDYNISSFPLQQKQAFDLFAGGVAPAGYPGSGSGTDNTLNLESTGRNADNGFARQGSEIPAFTRNVATGAGLEFQNNPTNAGSGGDFSPQRGLGQSPIEQRGGGSAVAPALEPQGLAVLHSVARHCAEDAFTDRTAELERLRAASDGALDYFAARGIPGALCARYGLFQSGGRAVMPVFDEAGRCLGWCARAIQPGVEPRYKNSSGPLPLWRAEPGPPRGQESRAEDSGTDNLLAPESSGGGRAASQSRTEDSGTDKLANLESSPQRGQESRAEDSGTDNLLAPESVGRAADNDFARQGSEIPAFTRNVATGAGLESPNNPTNAGYGGDFSPHRGLGQSPIYYVTEGILDALTLIAAGRRAVALCGSQNTRKLFTLAESDTAFAGTRYICCGDGDAAGRKMNAVLLDGFAQRGIACSALELPDGADINALYQTDSAAFTQLLESAETQRSEPPGTSDAEYDGLSALGALDDFFAQAARRAGNPGQSTGLLGLDAALGGGLRSGLIVLGAPSSIGKTSIVLQIADFAAHGGTDVLYFTLEMSRYELMAKSISRVSAELDDFSHRRALTARDILSGTPCMDLEQELLLRRARTEYARFAGHVFLREGLMDIGPLEIRKAVAEHIARRGGKPLVFVDYLQILAPSDTRATDKQNTDRAVVELKRLSRDFDIPVVAISSFNRDGYRSAAAMESFKESGAVEYSSDVLLALQLAGTGEPGFDANAQKLRDPRDIELVMLKNRSGTPYAKLPLVYHARFGLFTERAAGNARQKTR